MALREQVGVDVGAISILFTTQALGYLAGSLVGGRLYDRGLGHLPFAGSLVAVALLLLAVPLASDLAQLAALFALLGVAGGVLDVGGNTLLVWSRGSSVGPLMNALHLCFGIGALVTPLLVGATTSGGRDATGAFVVMAAVAASVGVWSLTRTAPPVPSRSGGGGSAHTPALLLAVVSFFFLLYVGVEAGFAGWVFTYAEEVELGGTGAAAWLTAAFWIAFTLGRVAAIGVARRVNPAPILATACSLAVAAAVVLVLAGGQGVAVWLGTVLFGLGVAPQYATMLTYAEAHLPITGAATAWFVGASSIGGLLLPWLIGQMIDAQGAAAMPAAVLGATIATLAWYLLVERLLHERRATSPPAGVTGAGEVVGSSPARRGDGHRDH